MYWQVHFQRRSIVKNYMNKQRCVYALSIALYWLRFRIRCSWSFVPSLQSLDLLTVQTLSHHRLDYLNTITTFLARVGGMPLYVFILSSMYIFSMV